MRPRLRPILPFVHYVKINYATGNWFKRHTNDPFVKLSTKEGYHSRAVYKLREIDEKFNLFRHRGKGDFKASDSVKALKVLDCGASPGSWSQYVKLCCPQASVLAVDLLPMECITGVKFVQADLRSAEFLDIARNHLLEQKQLQCLDTEPYEQYFDIIISDMAPDMSGIRSTDSYRSYELLVSVIELARGLLLSSNPVDGSFNGHQVKGNSSKSIPGTLLMKQLAGDSELEAIQLMKFFFKKVRKIKPMACRASSSEYYLLGEGFLRK